MDFIPPPSIWDKPTFSVSSIGIPRKMYHFLGVPVVGVPRKMYHFLGVPVVGVPRKMYHFLGVPVVGVPQNECASFGGSRSRGPQKVLHTFWGFPYGSPFILRPEGRRNPPRPCGPLLRFQRHRRISYRHQCDPCKEPSLRFL